MRLDHRGKIVRTDIWREGEYLDLWSVPHFLSGMAVAFGLYLLDFEMLAAFVIAFLLLVAYEMFEVIAKIEETRWNRTLDVVVGMASFTPTFLFLPRVSFPGVVGGFAAVLVLDCVLSYFGWSASRKAFILEQRLREEYARERARFLARREDLRVRWRARRGSRRPAEDAEA